MGLLNNYGVGAAGGVDAFFKNYYRGREHSLDKQKLEEEMKYRAMQEQLMQQQLAEKQRQQSEQEAVAKVIQQATTPQPVGPNPTQQYMSRVQGLVQPVKPQFESPTAGLAYAESGAQGIPRFTPEQARVKAMAEAQQGGFQQQAEIPKLDMKQLLVKMIGASPSHAPALVQSLAGLEKTDMADLAKMMMLQQSIASKEKIAGESIESKESMQKDKLDMLKTLAVIKATSGVGKSITDKMDYEAGKKLISTLPSLRKDAITSANSIDKMKQMLALVDQGAGGVTGQLKAFVAPYAEALGYNAKSLSDAQTFQLVAKTIAGSMRLDMVGSGQISNYENQLLQSVSGGGKTARAAAKKLYEIYTSSAQSKINAYNESVDALGDLSPKTKALWKKVESKGIGSEKTVVERRKGAKGMMVKYSDGSIGYE